MADFNAIGNPFLASGVPRLYGVDQPSIPVVSSEVQVVTSPWERPEFWALLGGTLGHGYFTMAAGGATTFNAQELRNPAGSGVLLIIERIIVCNDEGSATSYIWGLRANSPLSGSTGAWGCRDLRRATTTGGSGALAGRIRQQNTVGASTWDAQWGRITLAAATNYTVPLDVVLPPGWGMMVQNQQENRALIVSWFGRERPAPPPEIGSL